MRTRGAFVAFILTALLAACAAGEESQETASAESPQTESAETPPLPPDMPDMTPTMMLETSMGDIAIELDPENAPKTAENVVSLVESGFYDGLTFHRVIPGFMIQGGGFAPDMAQRKAQQTIPNEADNGLKNTRGTVAMARTNDPHSASSQFFINLVDNPRLDYTAKTPKGWGYTVFGRVTDGMDVVDSIAGVQTTSKPPYDDVPVDPVVIERAYMAGGAADE